MRTFLLFLSLLVSGCATAKRVAISFVYRKAFLPEKQIFRNLEYNPGAGGSVRQRLDLFAAAGTNWPILVFVHGGGWDTGDKGLQVGGADVYGNIGRFYASQGIGVAVINYRLMPNVTWREQTEDVTRAVSWIWRNIAAYGGNPNRIFIGGHSAGGYLAAMVALNPQPIAGVALPAGVVKGVISVSGAGLDLGDEETYALGASRSYYAKRFSGGEGDWKAEASPISYVRKSAPLFLLLFAGGEKAPLKRQSTKFVEALTRAGVPSRLVVIPGQSHTRIVLTLSRSDRIAGPEITDFILSNPRPGKTGARAEEESASQGVKR